jgi:hypothetical protein
MLSVRLFIVGAIVIYVPLVVMFQFVMLSISMLAFDPASCISTTDDVTQVMFALATALQ